MNINHKRLEETRQENQEGTYDVKMVKDGMRK